MRDTDHTHWALNLKINDKIICDLRKEHENKHLKMVILRSTSKTFSFTFSPLFGQILLILVGEKVAFSWTLNTSLLCLSLVIRLSFESFRAC